MSAPTREQQQQYAPPDYEDGGVLDQVLAATEEKLEVISGDALNELIRAEIDMQVATAKKYPRQLGIFKKNALEMATLDEDTAISCFYTLPRGGKKVTGPSVRLAEIIASAWGNIRFGARVVSDSGKFISAQGMCHDLERNSAVTIEVQRRITGKDGRRYNDDMVVVTGNAACSIALRNAIFRIVPMVYVRAIEKQCRLVAVGKAETLGARREKVVSWFVKAGASEEQICGIVGKQKVEDIGLDEVLTLRTLAAQIHSGETTMEEAFPSGEAGSKAATEKLKEKLANGHKKPDEPKPAEAKKPEPVSPAEGLAEGEVPNEPDPRDLEEWMAQAKGKLAECKTPNDVEAVKKWILGKDNDWIGEETSRDAIGYAEMIAKQLGVPATPTRPRRQV